MMRIIIYAVLALFLGGAAVVGVQKSGQQKENRVCFEDNCFLVELAKSQEEIRQGLMFRERLEPGTGMLFVFEKEGYYSFWMKNTIIPLDIVWIDGEKRVAFIGENTQPCREEACPPINPEKPAKYVLEVNAGTAKEINLEVGDAALIETKE